ncbi:hypothetical protein EEB11_12485 [Pseudotabrizicola sediminis]|uniref:Uncharacterized protein n=1 Tax=Pseudotabrizicola sediminis TaxID=2486418 RepID=A0ABY2KJG4_9RHOB|nr:hypothetical protein [Pseudotabrizicola sediminis]TGD42570.1 hypothetical protein EEB11_12485 [Pseudotabrizicola sediminis]
MLWQYARTTTAHNRVRRLLRGVVLLVALQTGSANAHVSGSGNVPVAGVPIVEITHGQMPVIARHGSDILALAARQPVTTADFQRVLNYAKIQRAYCLWGLVPGSISDEFSPFNACSHAYLAAMRDLLLRMTAEGGTPAAVDLARRVDTDMIASSTALEFCNYSATPYDTATVVQPVLTDMVGHPATVASLGGLGGFLILAAAMFVRWSAKAAVL